MFISGNGAPRISAPGRGGWRRPSRASNSRTIRVRPSARDARGGYLMNGQLPRLRLVSRRYSDSQRSLPSGSGHQRPANRRLSKPSARCSDTTASIVTVAKQNVLASSARFSVRLRWTTCRLSMTWASDTRCATTSYGEPCYAEARGRDCRNPSPRIVPLPSVRGVTEPASVTGAVRP